MSFIKSIKKNVEKIILYKLTEKVLENSIVPVDLFTDSINICFLDVETTGTNRENDKIIEIALKLVKLDKQNGNIISFESSYESFQDPEKNISKEITKITGITNEMVQGLEINWDSVEAIFEKSEFIVAHNAGFDRAFLDRYLPLSKDKIWACSINDINWLERDFTKKGLEILCYWHGFYYESHRAMNDVDALIHLLCHNSYKTDNPLSELIINSRKPYYKMIARDSSFDLKDVLKSNNYWWDGDNKYWWKRIDHSEIETEKQWLNEHIYKNYFKGIVEEIPVTEKYK